MTAPGLAITGEVHGLAKVHAAFLEVGERRIGLIRRTVRGLGIQLANHVKRNKLSGQVLNVITGRLRTSINDRYTEDSSSARSTVGTAVSYGRVWELGYFGTQNVRSHLRILRKRRSPSGRRGRITGFAIVREHTRNVANAPRPFLVPALQDMRDEARAKLARAAGGQP